ncbi:hypothetical protein M3Y99_00174200 [Aphelenchoides fujianensis]|nr:hypothetical protein M3Y99_00174200 [Aphelenchoides fujianensis]
MSAFFPPDGGVWPMGVKRRVEDERSLQLGRLVGDSGTVSFNLQRMRMLGEMESGIPRMKRFWELTAEKERVEAERCAQRHRLEKPYDFPKWRASDAFSASLVASAPTPALIPHDSRLPAHRANKLQETEAMAEIARRSIQEQAVIPGRHRSKSRISVDDFSDRSGGSSWFSGEEMRAFVDHDSIADMRSTRNFFEQASRAEDFENQLIPRPFVADNSVSVVPLNQVLSVQCATSPRTQPNSPPQDSVYSAPLQRSPAGPPPPVDSRPLSFLEREIAEQQRREEEYRQRQQHLGHLTLEDTFELWRSGNSVGLEAAVSRPLSSNGAFGFNGLPNGTAPNE